MPRVIHFEIPADDLDRAQRFYEEAFGWTFQVWEGPMDYRLAMTAPREAPGIDGGLTRRRHPGEGTTNTIDVADVDAAAGAVERAGGKIVMPKMAVAGVGWLAYALDTEGNAFGMMQSDPSAA